MVKNKLLFTAGIIILILGVTVFFLGVYMVLFDSGATSSQVKCYDRYGNEMIGQTCIETEHINMDGVVCLILGGVIIFISLGMITELGGH